MSSRSDVVKVIAFVMAAGLMLVLVGFAIGGFRIQSAESYRAVFADSSGLEDGVDVRAAGVTVGRVESLELQPDNTVLVGFSVPADLPVSTSTRAAVRFKNLTGDRYLDLTQGSGSSQRLPAGDTIPLDRTAPALDLDELFNGFKPLLQGLSPDDVNQLSTALIAVFQGQAGTVDSLLRHVGSLTQTLADRDQVVGTLIDNLSTVLGTVDARRAEFDTTVVQLQQLLSGLAADRDRIGTSLDGINELAGRTTTFLEALRPELTGTVEQTRRVSAALNHDLTRVDYYLNQIPILIQLLGRGGAYGSFFNFHLCGARVKLDGPTGPVLGPFLLSEEPRCLQPDEPSGGPPGPTTAADETDEADENGGDR